MREKLALVIAALMMTSMAFAISTTSVSASHERTVSIDDDTVKGNTFMIRTITIANDGPDAIDNVRIIVPTGWGPEPVKQVPKDNIVKAAVDNIVVLPAGTVVELSENADVTLADGTDVRVVEGKWIWVDVIGDNTRLNENAMVEVRQSTIAENILENDDIEVTGDISVNLNTDNQLRLLADTMVLVVSDNIMRLTKDTMVELVMTNENGIAGGENVKVAQNVTVILDNNRVRMVTDKPSNLKGFEIPTGENITLIDNEVVILAGAVVQLNADVDIRIPENTPVKREDNKQLDVSGATVENLPKNWTQDNGISALPSGVYLEWTGNGDNIASGASLDFPFAFTSPGGGDHTIYVRTKDTEGVIVMTEIALTVDNVPPTVEIAASPEWAKANTEVTITVTASEPLAKLDNVMVAENAATENTQVTMTPNADNTIWTGTYTTENEDYENDGTAMIYVIGSQYEDLIGNAGSGVDNATFTVDRLAPPAPDLSAIIGWPTSPTDIATWFIENEAMDNFLGSLVYLEGGIVKIRVGTTVYDVTPTVSGYYSKSITLTEGTQEVGIQYIDRAGNVGEENAENIILDTMGPSITWGTISGGKALVDGVRINDTTPTITLTISDAGLGVDNWAFAVDNTGYSVQLRYDNNDPIENLVNALAHDNNVLEFENTIYTISGWADNAYYIYVVAGDSQKMDNDLIKFVIDTEAPDAPVVDEAYKFDSTMDNPLVIKSTSRTIAGDAEAGATITVYGTVGTIESVLGTGTVGSGWTVQFTLTAGSNTKIEISATDEAGNESSRTLYGWILADDSVPSVTLDELPETTDKTSITISGTVGKDDWEVWSDITLTVQVGTGQVTVPIGAGGSYSYSLELAEGQNTIVVQAIDAVGNLSDAASDVVERTITPWMTYAIVLVVIVLLLAVIAILRR